MGDAARGDAGGFGDLTGRDPSTDRCTHRPVTRFSRPLLLSDGT